MNTRLAVKELEYELPTELIAKVPAEPRDAARMMVVRLGSEGVEHAQVRDLPKYLQRGDLMVFNRSGVARARLMMRRTDSGARMEGLFVRESGHLEGRWEVMIRGSSRLKPGMRLAVVDREDRDSEHMMELVERTGAHWIARIVGMGESRNRSSEHILEEVGRTPLPPYIVKARGANDRESGGTGGYSEERDRSSYQTVYADQEAQRSIAAPTAGLHFTGGLLERLEEIGVARADVRLHVGLGTFKPVETEYLDEHPMHEERYEVAVESLKQLREHLRQKREGNGGRLIAVGTTSVRVLESLGKQIESEEQIDGVTKLMISPGFEFKLVDGLLTNFHLPSSTLLALVGAIVGMERLMGLYKEAIRERYRFYSYGDAMLVLP